MAPTPKGEGMAPTVVRADAAEEGEEAEGEVREEGKKRKGRAGGKEG
jgi:hypothetical protein